jgi:hypothetical protein
MAQEILLTRTDDNVGVGLYDSIAWAYEVHVKQPDPRSYNAAILYGNEDAPERIDFYTSPEPLVTDKPAFIWMPEVDHA